LHQTTSLADYKRGGYVGKQVPRVLFADDLELGQGNAERCANAAGSYAIAFIEAGMSWAETLLDIWIRAQTALPRGEAAHFPTTGEIAQCFRRRPMVERPSRNGWSTSRCVKKRSAAEFPRDERLRMSLPATMAVARSSDFSQGSTWALRLQH
jgi:hypothetical protein